MLSPYYICLIMACVLFILFAGFFSDKHDSRTLCFVIICNIEVAENKYVIKCIML